MAGKVVQFSVTDLGLLSKEQACQIIRLRASSTENVIFGDHAIERMLERDITRTDISTVLLEGEAREVTRADGGDWKVLMVKRITGVHVGVVTIILMENELYIVTVEEVI